MLVVKDVSYKIGKLSLVEDINLSIPQGELVAIVGANGAGKTTLLRLLAGEIQASKGDVILDGKSLSIYKAHELALQRAVMRQHVFMNFDFTSYEIVMMGRHPHIRSGETKADHAIIEQALATTETNHLREQLYSTLSSGEKARITLARVLAQQTKVLLLDEPTGTMDMRHQQMTMKLIRDFANDSGVVVAIVHDLNLAAMYADRIAIMKQGKMLAIGKPDEILTANNIRNAFNLEVEVMSHPRYHCPMVIPLMP